MRAMDKESPLELRQQFRSVHMRGTGIAKKECELRGWTKEENKVVLRIAIRDCFEAARKRPRRQLPKNKIPIM